MIILREKDVGVAHYLNVRFIIYHPFQCTYLFCHRQTTADIEKPFFFGRLNVGLLQNPT